MDIIFHYPPELVQLLIQAIPLLARSKKDVILFFKGAGVSSHSLADVTSQVERDKDGITKYEIVRQVLSRLNEMGEKAIGERRQVLRQVVEFEDFSTCWPDDQLKAKGLVAEIRRVINVKDSFTRINQERDKEAAARRAAFDHKQKDRLARRAAIDEVRTQIGALFKEGHPQKRGALLESAIAGLFRVYGVLIRESFRVVDDKGAGVLEQIDGVIELEGTLYLVEIKWLSGAVGVEDVSRHLVRIYHRNSARGLFVSMTTFSAASVAVCVEALQRTVVALATLDELVALLEDYGELGELLKQKINAAILDKNPYHRVGRGSSFGGA